jgi:cell division protein FtsQ
MRSVRAERASRGSRDAAPARSARSGKRTATQRAAGGGRAKPRQSQFSRFRQWFGGWLSVRSPMLLLGLGFVGLAFLVALLVSGVVGRTIRQTRTATDAVVADAGFGISQVHLSGNNRVPPETLLAALGYNLGESIFAVDLRAARERLMALDWVADADVQRRYPDSISVRIVEKLPFALWKSPDGVVVVERSGRTITHKDVESFARLPHLAGDSAPQQAAEIVDGVALHRAVAARVKIYQYVSERRWNLVLDDGVVVQLPDTGWQKQLDTLEHLIVDNGILERNLTEIDLRSPTQYFFTLKNGQTKNIDRGREL